MEQVVALGEHCRVVPLLGNFKCIDAFGHGGGWPTALEVEGGRRVLQANEAGELRG